MKSISIAIFSFLLLTGIDLIAQTRQYETNPDRKRTNIWYFGQHAGIDFNNSHSTALTNGRTNISEEGGGIMCDTMGQLLFYTDGRTIWNKNHDTLENGFGLNGHPSSSQAGLILKHPSNDSLYYILNTPYCYNYSNGLTVSIVNIFINNGLGKVIIKNKLLNSNSSEKISAAYHSNGKDIWIIGHEYGNNRFFKFLLQKNGINNCPIYQDTGVIYQFISPNGSGPFMNQGFIKFSPDNKFMVHIFTPEYISTQFRRLELYDFNSLNGELSLNSIINFEKWAWDAEFSGNSKNLIFSDRDSFSTIYNIKSGLKKQLKIRLASQFESIPLQLAVDGNIYFGRLDSSNINIINNSNNFQNVQIINNYLNLQTGVCKYSLPNIFSSYFHTPSIDFTYDLDCIGNSANFQGRDTFYADIHQWVIGKPGKPLEASYSTKNVTHIFKDTGGYRITYTASKGNKSDTILKTIKIYPKVRRDFLGRDTAYETGTGFSRTFTSPLGMHCYFWHNDSSASPSFTTDTTGIFVCKVTTKSFCTVTDTVKIFSCINDLSVPTILRSRDTIYVSSNDADSFVWYRNGLFFKSGKERFLAMTDTGLYKVEAIKPGHCNRSSQTYHVQKLGVQEHLIQGIRVFPNPTKNWISLEFKNRDSYTIVIYDVIGKKVYEAKSDNDTNIKLDGLQDGVYLLRITNTNNQQFNTKILKE